GIRECRIRRWRAGRLGALPRRGRGRFGRRHGRRRRGRWRLRFWRLRFLYALPQQRNPVLDVLPFGRARLDFEIALVVLDRLLGSAGNPLDLGHVVKEERQRLELVAGLEFEDGVREFAPLDVCTAGLIMDLRQFSRRDWLRVQRREGWAADEKDHRDKA